MNAAPRTPEQAAAIFFRLVSHRDMDGYSMASASGLTLAEMEGAVALLVQKGVLRVKGTPTGDKLFDCWFQAIPTSNAFSSSSYPSGSFL